MATRFYPMRTSVGFSAIGYVGTPDAAWDWITDAVARLMHLAKQAEPTGAGPRVTSMAPNGLSHGFISPQLQAQTITGTVKAQFKCREFNLADNTTSCIGIRVINATGSVVRGTLLAVGNQSLAGELVETTTHRNKKFAAATALGSVNALEGDRIEVSIGFTHAAGTTPEGQVVLGSDNAGDLPEDDTSTAALDPFIEFSQTLLFSTIVTPTTAALVLTTFAPTVTAPNNVAVVPTTATLALATFAPTVTASDLITVVPGTAALALTAFAPTVTASDHFIVVPATANLVLTSFEPTVSLSNQTVLIPGTATLVLTTFEPTVTGSGVVPPLIPEPPDPPPRPPRPPRPPPPTYSGVGADLILTRGDLELDLGFRTAVFVSLFTDARRPPTDPAPSINDDPRGWWADRGGDRIGSLLWLLEREKVLDATIDRARRYAQEALRWMIDDGMASAINVLAERGPGVDRIDLSVEIVRSRNTRWTSNWSAVERESESVGRYKVSILVR